MTQATLEFHDQVALITLDNGPQNRLSIEMLDEFDAVLAEIENRGARAAVVCAEGPDFSFGGDIVPWIDRDSMALRGLFERFMRSFNHFERLPMPTVAVAQGRCFGGGFELALRADLVFAGASAVFGHPEQTLAIVTMLGGLYRAAERVGRAKAMEWALTSEPIPAAVLEQRGIVNRICPDDQLRTEALAFAQKLAKGPTRAHAAHKALLRIWSLGGVAAADQAMFDIAMPLFETQDVKTALPASVDAFLEGRPRPAFPFTGN